MRAREDIIRALRCCAACGEPLDCTGCPYLLEDKDEDGVLIQDCNAVAIFRDTVEMLENDKRTISGAGRGPEVLHGEVRKAEKPGAAEQLRATGGGSGR